MNEPGAGYQPSDEEIQAAKESMTDAHSDPVLPDSDKATLSLETPLPKENSIRIKEAKTLFGSSFFGPDEARSIFGLEVVNIPAINATREELKQAKALGQILILQLPITIEQIIKTLKGKTKNGKKLLYGLDKSTGELQGNNLYNHRGIFKENISEPCWQLVSPDVIPGSLDKDYWGQTEALADYLWYNFSVGGKLPPEYQDAIDEMEQLRNDRFGTKSSEEIHEIISDDHRYYAGRIARLKINQLYRQTANQVLYTMAGYERKTGQRILYNYCTSTNTIWESYGELVYVGFFDDNGSSIDSGRPDYLRPGLGVCFSQTL